MSYEEYGNYVYILRRPDRKDPFDQTKGQPFYIGIGKKCRFQEHKSEATVLLRRPSPEPIPQKILVIHKIWAKNLDFEVDIIFKNLTRERAYEIEIELIKKYGRLYNKTGILTNKTPGGPGRNGWNETQKLKITKDKIRKEKNMDIRPLLTPKERKKTSFDKKTHPLKSFFRARNISQVSLCEFLNIKGNYQSSLSIYFSDREKMPKHIESKLQKIADKILEDEAKKLKKTKEKA